MNNPVIQPPPPRQRSGGCCGKGCLLLVGLFLLLSVLFIAGGYIGAKYVITSDKPRDIPTVTTSVEEQQVVRQRWEEFQKANDSNQPAQVQYTAEDLNQLIAANRKARGKAFVRIENNVGHVQVSIPLEKVGFRGRFLNGEFEVHASPDRDPKKMRVEKISLSGIDVPEQALNSLIGGRSLASYIDEYSSKYQVTGFAIENNAVTLETNTPPR